MSYRVLTDSGIPYVHSLSGLGLGQGTTVEIAKSDLPWWQQIAIPVGQSVGTAVSSRIAYGQQPYGGYPSGFMFQGPTGGAYGGGAYGSFQPSTLLLIGGAALLALMMFRK